MKKKIIIDALRDFKWLIILLILSILVIIKFSTAPVCADILLPVLQCPEENSYQYEIYRILENLSLAYIASLIFYIITTYYPQVKAEIQAFELVKNKIEYVYTIMADVLAYFSFACNIDDFTNISNEKEEEIDNFSFPEDRQFLMRRTTEQNGKQRSQVEYSDCQEKIVQAGKQLKKTLDKILAMIDNTTNIQGILGQIKRIRFSEFLTTMTQTMDAPHIDDVQWLYLGLCTDLCAFYRLFQQFEPYQFKKEKINYRIATQSERQAWAKFQLEIHQQHPEIPHIMEQLNNQ